MRFRGQVDGRLRGKRSQPVLAVVGEGARQRDDDCRQIRLRAATREARRRLGGQPELPRQPGEGVSLDLVGRGRRPPGRELRVVHRDERVRDDRRERDAGVEQPEIARVRDVNLPSLQHLLDVGDDVGQRQRLREIVPRGEIAPDLVGRHAGDDGAGRDDVLHLADTAAERVEEHSSIPSAGARLFACAGTPASCDTGAPRPGARCSSRLPWRARRGTR